MYRFIFRVAGLGTVFAMYLTVKKVFIKKSFLFPSAAVRVPGAAAVFPEAGTEAVRKSLHFLIALCPGMAAMNYSMTILLLSGGILCYTVMEMLRLSGIRVPVVSALTDMASRKRDLGRFVAGPVTLGTGALFALLLLPAPAAQIGIFALAFGDGFAGLAGKMFGKTRPAFLYGKSVEGSLACFTATFLFAFFVSNNFTVSLIAAVTATAVEALPLKDCDNILLPLAVGFAVRLAMNG